MSQSRELQLHIAQMVEIRSILNSMKNLAFMEIHKLLRFQTMQNKVVDAIETAALDFLNFYPYSADDGAKAPHFVILFGAERGFCGDFNESLINDIATANDAGVILIGTRLSNRWPDTYPEPIAMLEGANAAEEAPAVVNKLLGEISLLQEAHSYFKLTAVYHDAASHRITHKPLLPPFQQSDQDKPHTNLPPLLNLEPAEFFAQMAEQYLFAALHQICYTSLMTENHRRLQHLEGAVLHLDNETVKLRRKSQIFRQEEITEEIEVILLNAENL
ncbi:MAG: F0F1 ATP synthase subunit gamma [Gammaproteobacteria bacterium]